MAFGLEENVIFSSSLPSFVLSFSHRAFYFRGPQLKVDDEENRMPASASIFNLCNYTVHHANAWDQDDNNKEDNELIFLHRLPLILLPSLPSLAWLSWSPSCAQGNFFSKVGFISLPAFLNAQLATSKHNKLEMLSTWMCVECYEGRKGTIFFSEPIQDKSSVRFSCCCFFLSSLWISFFCVLLVLGAAWKWKCCTGNRIMVKLTLSASSWCSYWSASAGGRWWRLLDSRPLCS